jgi:hypothetical protein
MKEKNFHQWIFVGLSPLHFGKNQLWKDTSVKKEVKISRGKAFWENNITND